MYYGHGKVGFDCSGCLKVNHLSSYCTICRLQSEKAKHINFKHVIQNCPSYRPGYYINNGRHLCD